MGKIGLGIMSVVSALKIPCINRHILGGSLCGPYAQGICHRHHSSTIGRQLSQRSFSSTVRNHLIIDALFPRGIIYRSIPDYASPSIETHTSVPNCIHVVHGRLPDHPSQSFGCIWPGWYTRARRDNGLSGNTFERVTRGTRVIKYLLFRYYIWINVRLVFFWNNELRCIMNFDRKTTVLKAVGLDAISQSHLRV